MPVKCGIKLLMDPFLTCCTVEVWEWISSLILHFVMDVTIYLCWDWSWSMLVKSVLGCFSGTLTMVGLPQRLRDHPEGYGLNCLISNHNKTWQKWPVCTIQHWKGNVVIFMKFSSLAAAKVVKWQLAVPPVMKIPLKWRNLCFSARACTVEFTDLINLRNLCCRLHCEAPGMTKTYLCCRLHCEAPEMTKTFEWKLRSVNFESTGSIYIKIYIYIYNWY